MPSIDPRPARLCPARPLLVFDMSRRAVMANAWSMCGRGGETWFHLRKARRSAARNARTLPAGSVNNPLSIHKGVGWQLLGVLDPALIDLTNLLAARLTTGSIGGCAGYAEERLNSSFG